MAIKQNIPTTPFIIASMALDEIVKRLISAVLADNDCNS
jgi:hypothetical protein